MHSALNTVATGHLSTATSPVRKILVGLLDRIVAAEKSYRDRAHIAALSDQTCEDVALTRHQMLNNTVR